MGASGPMIALTALSSGTQTYLELERQKMESNYQRSQLEMNRRMAELQASDAIARGEREVGVLRGKTARLVGSQKAAIAAQGIDITSGSAADVVSSTEALSDADAITIKNNAAREAFGFRSQAIQYGHQGAMVGIGARFNRAATLLTAGMNFGASSMRDYSLYKTQRRV